MLNVLESFQKNRFISPHIGYSVPSANGASVDVGVGVGVVVGVGVGVGVGQAAPVVAVWFTHVAFMLPVRSTVLLLNVYAVSALSPAHVAEVVLLE